MPWPWSTTRFHAPVELFPGIGRANVFSARNVRELSVELSWGIPALLIAWWLTRRRVDA